MTAQVHNSCFGNNPSLARLLAKSYANVVIFVIQKNIVIKSANAIKVFFSSKECSAGEYGNLACF